MMTTSTETRTPADAIYDSLPTVDDGWATAKAVAEATGLGYSTVTRQLRELQDAGRVEYSEDPDHTGGARGKVWRQTGIEDDELERAADADLSFCRKCGHLCACEAEPHPLIDSDIGPVCEDDAACAQRAQDPIPEEGYAETYPEAEGAASSDVEPADRGTPAAGFLSADQARALTDRIRGQVADLLPLIREAYVRRADQALGYASWTAYCDTELRGLRMRLEERQAATAELRAAGMSTRAIAGAVGSSDATVRRDLRASGATDDAPERATGLDGRSYPTTRLKPEPAPETQTAAAADPVTSDAADGAEGLTSPVDAPAGDGGVSIAAVPGPSPAPVVEGEVLAPRRYFGDAANINAVTAAIDTLRLAIDVVEEALRGGPGGPGSLPDLRHERNRLDKLIRAIAAWTAPEPA